MQTMVSTTVQKKKETRTAVQKHIYVCIATRPSTLCAGRYRTDKHRHVLRKSPTPPAIYDMRSASSANFPARASVKQPLSRDAANKFQAPECDRLA